MRAGLLVLALAVVLASCAKMPTSQEANDGILPTFAWRARTEENLLSRTEHIEALLACPITSWRIPSAESVFSDVCRVRNARREHSASALAAPGGVAQPTAVEAVP